MKLIKTGRFAFDGVKVKNVNEDTIDQISDIWKKQLVKAGWLSENIKQSPKPVVQEEPSKNDGQNYLSIDWDFVNELVEAGNKLDLDEYAATFGIKLKRNKTIENMLNDFKGEAKS